MLRALAYAVVFYVNTAAFMLLGVWLLAGPRRWAMEGLRLHALASLWWLKVIVGTRLEVRGREHIPDGPCLIAAKHQSAWDTFALIPLFRDPALVMKAELRHIPFYGWFSRKFEHIFVERDRGPVALRKMVRDAKDRIAQGRDVLIFPEGTRRTPGTEPDYKSGVLALYDGLGAPCLPLALNSGLYWPRRSLERYPGTIVVEILPPIPPGLPRKEFAQRLEEAIEGMCDRLLLESAGSAVPPPLPPEATARIALLGSGAGRGQQAGT